MTQVFSISTYVNYFRLMAASHSSIQHNIAAESPDFADKSQCRFTMFSHDEVVGGLRSRIGDGVNVFLHPYFTKPSSNGAGDYRTRHTAAFIIAQKVNHNDVAALTAALNNTEFIMYTFIMQLVRDANEFGATCRLKNPFSGCEFNDMKLEPVFNLWDGRAGWYVEFEFVLKQNKFYMNPALYNESTTWLPVGTAPNDYPLTP